MNYNDLVLTVEQCGSISKAAALLGVSQPAISAGLNSLEKKLGYPLFDRKVSPVVPTEEGKAYIAYLHEKDILEENLENRIRDIRQKGGGIIRIGAPSAYVDPLIVPCIKEFTTRFPGSGIQVIDGSVRSLTERISRNELDLFISTSAELPENIRTDILLKEHIRLCVPSELPVNRQLREALAKRKENAFQLEVLKDENFIFLNSSQPLQKLTDAYLEQHSFRPGCSIRVEQTASAVRLAISGCGICFASELILKQLSGRSDLCIYQLPDEYFCRDIYLARIKKKYLSEIQSGFINMLKQKQEVSNHDTT